MNNSNFAILVIAMSSLCSQATVIAMESQEISTSIRMRAQAESLYREGHFKESLAKIQSALEMQQNALMAGDVEIGRTYFVMGMILSDLNRREDAEKAYRESISILKEKLGITHPAVAICMDRLSEILRETGELIEAEKLLQVASTNLKKSIGEDAPATQRVFRHLASIYLDQHRAAEAGKILEQLLRQLEKGTPPDQVELVITLRLLGLAMMLQSRNVEAESVLIRALEIDEKLGRSNPNVAETLDLLARVHSQLGNFDVSIGEYERAIDIKKRHLEITIHRLRLA